jgi:amidase
VIDDLALLDAIDQSALVRRGEVQPLELVDAAIERIERVNPQLHAVIHERFDAARADAVGPLPDGPFRGVPLLLKDMDASMAGEPLHLGNRLLRDLGHVADHDDYLVQRLVGAGFVVVGKTNASEFGLVPTTEPLAQGPTHNPWAPERSTSGSSGGSAAAVAAGLVPVAHGGDGGGSIRTPAGHCGIFGLKPSRGRVSLGPDIGEGWNGFLVRHALTRSVRDSAAVLDVLAGPMPGDPYTAPAPPCPFLDEVGRDPGRLRIGVRTTAPSDLATVDPECVAAVEHAARLLESLGHAIEPVAIPALDAGPLVASFVSVMVGGVMFEMNRLAEIAGRALTEDDVEPLTWLQYQMGLATTADQYVEAMYNAHRFTRDVVAWWQDGYDLLVTPTTAEPAPFLGDLVSTPEDPMRPMTRAVPFAAFTVPFNVTGQPAMSVPLHWTADGIPVGVQLVADQYREDVLLRVAAQLEHAQPWAARRPPIAA